MVNQCKPNEERSSRGILNSSYLVYFVMGTIDQFCAGIMALPIPCIQEILTAELILV